MLIEADLSKIIACATETLGVRSIKEQTRENFIMVRIFILISILLTSITASARDKIRIVGSSTVYPFVTIAAEEFSEDGNPAPIVESTGTGGGFNLFCMGVGKEYPDIVNASRPVKESENVRCSKNGISPIEVKLGYDGIVLANARGGLHYNLSLEDIFKAMALEVPKDGKLVENYYEKWSDIRDALPDIEISVYGPPATSGTRDAFVELVLQPACMNLPEFKEKYKDKKKRKKACHQIREDGHFFETGENDNLIIQKLRNNKDALGIFGFSFLNENIDAVQASIIDGYGASMYNISEGLYPVSRALFVYVKKEHVGYIPNLREFIHSLLSEDLVGEEGYLAEKGLIALPEDELAKIKAEF